MSCPFPARSCIHSCTARACTLMRAHADTHNNLHPPLLGPRSPHSHLLPSSTLLNFAAPALLSPFYPPSLIVSYGIQKRRQVRWNHVHNVSTGFHSLFWGGGVLCILSSVLSAIPKTSFSPTNFSHTLSAYTCYARCVFTHYARKETGAGAIGSYIFTCSAVRSETFPPARVKCGCHQTDSSGPEL